MLLCVQSIPEIILQSTSRIIIHLLAREENSECWHKFYLKFTNVLILFSHTDPTLYSIKKLSIYSI